MDCTFSELTPKGVFLPFSLSHSRSKPRPSASCKGAEEVKSRGQGHSVDINSLGLGRFSSIHASGLFSVFLSFFLPEHQASRTAATANPEQVQRDCSTQVTFAESAAAGMPGLVPYLIISCPAAGVPGAPAFVRLQGNPRENKLAATAAYTIGCMLPYAAQQPHACMPSYLPSCSSDHPIHPAAAMSVQYFSRAFRSTRFDFMDSLQVGVWRCWRGVS